ncbi:cathepsin W isoform X2 [Saccopteryx bilineata]|uniref:cathepsin W isoform X2 n=1 Tax=Saccopteryx bilineata TaxID=59482 RepID=UPI00338F7681
MELTVHLSCLLALLVAGLAQGIKGSLRSQDPWTRPLELKEFFSLFQIQYNRSYSSPEEEEFGQLFGHQRAAERAPNVNRKVESDEEWESVPPTCDWRKAAGVISPVKNQVSAPPSLLLASPSGGRRGGARPCPLPSPFPLPTRKPACAAGPWRRQETSKPSGALNIGSLWKSLCRVRPGEGACVPVGVWRMGSGAWSPTFSFLAPELLDCGRCGDGCRGGFVWDAYITVLNNSGLASEKDYPFQGDVRTHRCQAKKHQKVAWIQDFIMLSGNEQGIARYLATEGPITVTINKKLLQHYQKGVIKATPTTCDPHQVDHVVLLVGFGKTRSAERRQEEAVSSQSPFRHSTPYWILKNSWGANWGEKGYFRLHRGSNACGFTKYPLTARVATAKKQNLVSCPP